MSRNNSSHTRNNRAFPNSIEPGIPTLGTTPRGWLRLSMGDLIQSIERPVQLVDNQIYQLVTAKRNRSGIVGREKLLGNQIRVNEQFIVNYGDFIISNRQISHGACGIIPEHLHGSIVSNEYTVVRTRSCIDINYLNILSNSKYFQQTCFHSSIGVHVEKLVFKFSEWLKWQFDIPPIEEQKRIVEFLNTCDRYINLTSKLIKEKQDFFDGLLHHLIGIHQNTTDNNTNWHRAELSSLVTLKSGGTPNRAISSFWGGTIPWISAKDLKSFEISDSINTLTEEGAAKVNVVPPGTTLLLVRGMGLFKDIPIGIATRAMAFNQDIKALFPKFSIHPRFLAYVLRARRVVLMDRVDQAGHGTGRLTTDFLETLPITFPNKSKQAQIVRTLDAAYFEIKLVQQMIEWLRLQRQGLMQKLLSGEWRLDERFDDPSFTSLRLLLSDATLDNRREHAS